MIIIADLSKNPEIENDFQIKPIEEGAPVSKSITENRKNLSGKTFSPASFEGEINGDNDGELTVNFTANEINTRLRRARGLTSRDRETKYPSAGRPKGKSLEQPQVKHNSLLPKGWGTKPISIEDADLIMRNAEKRREIAQQFEPNDNSKYLNFTLMLYQLGEVDLDDAEAVRDRVFGYFQLCADYDMKPSMAELALSMRMTRSQLYWYKNNSGAKRLKREVRETLRMAETIMDAQMNAYMLNGKVNPVSGIFLMKNNFGYRDKTEVEVAPAGGFNALNDPSLDDIIAALPEEERITLEGGAYKVEQSQQAQRDTSPINPDTVGDVCGLYDDSGE